MPLAESVHSRLIRPADSDTRQVLGSTGLTATFELYPCNSWQLYTNQPLLLFLSNDKCLIPAFRLLTGMALFGLIRLIYPLIQMAVGPLSCQ